jgi:hypothetical protein
MHLRLLERLTPSRSHIILTREVSRKGRMPYSRQSGTAQASRLQRLERRWR